jgi:hypothetical protein
VAEHVRTIAATVSDIVGKTAAALAELNDAALRKHAPPVVAVLEAAVRDMQAAQARGAIDRIPPLAFRIARATKELVLRVERIEAGDVTVNTELPAEF